MCYCEICEIYENTFFYRTPQVAASVTLLLFDLSWKKSVVWTLYLKTLAYIFLAFFWIERHKSFSGGVLEVLKADLKNFAIFTGK